MSLKSELDKFGSLLTSKVKTGVKATLRWVECTSVDWEARTMDAEDSEGLEYFDVLIGVFSTAVKPVVGTDCLIAMVEGDDATAYLLQADEADLIQFNGGECGGLVKIMELEKKLNNLVEKVNNHIHSGVIVAVSGGSGAPAVGTPGNSGKPTTTIPNFMKEDFENEKITHG